METNWESASASLNIVPDIVYAGNLWGSGV